MTEIRLGKTEIRVPKNGFGALPIQRISVQAATHLLQKAYENGIRFFDTARFYTDSEEKIGQALASVRGHIYLASKTMATTVADFWADLETSLSLLQTEYLDIYQFHNPSFCPKPGDGSGLYEAMLEAKAQGKVHHIGISNHRLSVAREALECGLYDTLQFPFCYLATEKELEIVALAKERDIGFIAMKGLSGGLLTNAAAAYAYLDQFDHVLPIWGLQREAELDAFLACMKNPPLMNAKFQALIEKDRQQLLGSFCRACGYCMPCPVGIEINTCARMAQLIRRSPAALQLTEEVQAKMRKIEECIHCNQCKKKCPYGLDTPSLLAENYRDYQEILSGKLPV